jgi:phasin
MAKADTKIPAEFVQVSSENVRGMAEKGLAQSRDVYEKLNASAKETAVSLEASATIVAKGISELNAKAFAALQSNTAATFDYLNALAALKAPTEVVSLNSAFAEQQFKALGDQAKDISALAQKITKDCIEPLKSQFEKTLKPAA